MTTIAVIGAGPLGGALARTLAERDRVRHIRLIDPDVRVAEGKALDILESSPIEGFTTRLDAAPTIAAAAGADVIVLADLVSGGEIAGEPGLALVRQLARMEPSSPFLFAAAGQRELMSRSISELHIAPQRLLGSAPLALESAVRAVVAALLDGSPLDLAIGIAGVPPVNAVIAWDAATAFNQPLARVLAPHRMAAVSSRLPALWPPAPYTLASAGARIAEALACGGRRRFTCFAAIERSDEGRDLVAAVPVEIVRGAIGRVIEPALSRHERTAFENGLQCSRG